MGGKRADRTNRRGGAFMVAVLAVVLVAGGAGAYALTRDGGEGGEAEASNASGGRGEPSPGTSTGSGEAAQAADGGTTSSDGDEAACAAQVRAADEVVAAARQGIGHLETHIGAHQDWALGRIDEEEKKAVYLESKLAGPADIEEWDRAVEAYEAERGGCRGVDNECADRMGALGRTIGAARMGMRHWDDHLGNMASFAEGRFDALEAQGRWDATIAEMPAMVAPFDDAMSRLKTAPVCS